MNILLAVDGSPFTKKMLAYLAAHEELLGTGHHYTALTVHPPLPAHARASLSKELVEDYYAEENQKVLDPVVKFMATKGVALQTIAKVGHIAETIAEVASANKQFDLLVMGSHGHGALATLVMGSITTKVLAQSTVPVMIVR